MSFELDDSNPENPLIRKRPLDFGFDSWLDLFIEKSQDIESYGLPKDHVSLYCETLRWSVQSILAYLVEFELNKPQKEGVDKAFS